MERLSENKIILVKRKSRLDELISRFNTISQAKFYIEHLGADFSDYLKEHEEYNNAIFKAKKSLDLLGRVQTVDRTFVPNFIFGPNDIVVAIGQDGLVANTLKYLSSQPLIGVNPDPKRWDGILLPFKVKDLKYIVPEVFKNRRQIKEVTLAKAILTDGQTLYAVNDLFIGQKSHVSARYRIQSGEKAEQQSSSGIIISTGLGSSAWFKSILSGATEIVNSFMENKITLPLKQFDWGANYLFFSVREPFPSKTSGTGLVFGDINKDKPLRILSCMPENGVIFSDGIENDFLTFNSGISATISVAEKKGQLVV